MSWFINPMNTIVIGLINHSEIEVMWPPAERDFVNVRRPHIVWIKITDLGNQ